MDRDEVARRLEHIRRVVREELAMKEPGVFDDSVREEVPFHLRPGIGVVISGEPDLAVSEHLTAANQAADIFAPTKSNAPVVGPIIDILRRLGRPFVKIFVGSELGRQQQFNAHAVRHMNELGNHLEQRVHRLEEAIEMWSANPGGIDARVRKSLHDYDAALRQRHMTLFSALEEEVLVAHKAAAGLQALETRFVQRAQAIDQRFAEKDNVLNQEVAALRKGEGEMRSAVERMEGQVGEVMALRSLLHKALQSGAPARAGGGGATAVAGSGSGSEGAAAAAGSGGEGATAATGSGGGGGAAASSGEPNSWSELGEWMGDEDYRSFQDRFRGDPEIIAERMRDHVARFTAAPGVVVDLGCGRGEFLDLLQAAGIGAVGVEINAADVEECRQRGHAAEVADLFEWLGAQDDGSLGGIFMAQVIEHLPPTDWQRFVELGAAKLMAGGRLVVETINPESLYALARAYVIDPTHIRPVHPELLAFLARRAGLHPVDIDYQSPVPDDERPGGLAFFRDPPAAGISAELADLKEALVRLDRICCAPQEYTLQATRPDFGDPS